MTPTELRDPWWAETPKGAGRVRYMTWASLEQSVYWTVFLENGQIWTFPNEQVRAGKNITAERPAPQKPIGRGEWLCSCKNPVSNPPCWACRRP